MFPQDSFKPVFLDETSQPGTILNKRNHMSSEEVSNSQSVKHSPPCITADLARTVFLFQSLVGLGLSLAGLIAGVQLALSLACGSLCTLMPALIFNLFLHRPSLAGSSHESFLSNYYRAEAIKLTSTVILLIVALNLQSLAAPAILAGFLVSLVGGWLALILVSLRGARHGT